MTSFNLNNKVGFRVATQKGEDLLKEYYYHNYGWYDNNLKDYIDRKWKELKAKIDNKEYIYEQAWVFMNIYGAHIGNGFVNPIETEVVLKDK